MTATTNTTAHITVLGGNLFSASTDGIDVMASARRYAEMVSTAMQSDVPGLEVTTEVQNAEGAGREIRIDCDDYDTEQTVEDSYERNAEAIFLGGEWVVNN